MLPMSFAVVLASILVLPTNAQSSSSSVSVSVSASATTSAALVVPTSFAGTDWTYAGCYNDPSTTGAAHVLSNFYTSATNMTQASCVRTCDAGGWGYAGLVYGAQCICGNVLATTATKATEAQCDYPCAGDTTQTSKCGGIFLASLFRNVNLLAASGISVSTSASSTAGVASSTGARTSSSFVTSRRSSTLASSALASASSVAAGSGTLVAGGKSNSGAIAGGVIGGLAAVVAVIVIFFLIRRKRRNNAWNDRPRSSFVGGSAGGGGSGSGNGGGGGWTRGGSVEDDGLVGAGTGAGVAGVGAMGAARDGRKEHAEFDQSTEKVGLDELSVVPLTSPRHPANLYSYEQQSQPAFFVPTSSPSSQPNYPSNNAPQAPPQVEYLADNNHRPHSPTSSPSSSPPTSSNPILQNSTSYGAAPPRRPSETSSTSHAPVSASGAASAAGGGVSVGRVVSVTRKNRKPVPVLAREDEEDAYDGLAYDAPPHPTRPSSVATSGVGWEGSKQMRVMGVDMPEEPRR